MRRKGVGWYGGLKYVPIPCVTKHLWVRYAKAQEGQTQDTGLAGSAGKNLIIANA